MFCIENKHKLKAAEFSGRRQEVRKFRAKVARGGRGNRGPATVAGAIIGGIAGHEIDRDRDCYRYRYRNYPGQGYYGPYGY
jgi:hypothetical protein